MDFQLVVTLVLLVVCVFFFIINKPRMDIVALLALLALPLLGILDMKETLSGFCDQSVILIALMFVVSESLVRTGVSTDVGEWILKKAGGSEVRLIIFLMAAVALFGSVMSSTGIVALFIPAVLSICTKLKISPSRLMMPLSFAGLISGMMSLVATPPNMVTDSILRREGFEGFSFFGITPIGIIVLAAGIVYIICTRRFLGGNNVAADDSDDGSAALPTLAELSRRYELSWHVCVFVVLPNSSLCLKKIGELPLRSQFGANIVCIERRERLGRRFISPEAETILREGDALLVDFSKENNTAENDSAAELGKRFGLELHSAGESGRFKNPEREFGLIEVAVMPDSPLAGRTPIESRVRTLYGMEIMGVIRKGKAFHKNVTDIKLAVGDMLLLAGTWKAAEGLRRHRDSFIVLNVPEEFKHKTDAPGRAPFALGALALMVFLMIFGIVPNALAALIACLLLVATQCIDMDRAYSSINWKSLMLIIGMIPFAAALEKTGGIEIASDALLQIFGGNAAASPRLVLCVLMAFTMLVGLFISNTVTAVLLAPVAITIARALGLDPLPFAMGVAVAASTAFMTPISSPVNALVLGPGRYRFIDFVKLGVPFSALVLAIGVFFIPIFFPFKPLPNAAPATPTSEQPAQQTTAQDAPATVAVVMNS